MNIKKSFSFLTIIALFSCAAITASEEGEKPSWTRFSLNWTVSPVWKFCAAPVNMIRGQEDFDKYQAIHSIKEYDDKVAMTNVIDKDKFFQNRSLQYRNKQWALTAVSLLSAGAAVWSFKAGHPCGYHDNKVKTGLVATALTTAFGAWKMGRKDQSNFEHAVKKAQTVEE